MYLMHLPELLAPENVEFRVITTGHATELLTRKGMPAIPLPPGATGASLLDAYRPALVIVGTSENESSFSFELIEAARARGIATVGVVDGAANAAERFRGRGDAPLSFAPDWLMVPDAGTALEFGRLGFRADRIRVCGHPQLDQVAALRGSWGAEERRHMRKRWLPGAPPGRAVLMFVSEICTGLNPQQFRRSPAYTLQGNPESDGRTEIVLDELLRALGELPEKPYLVLRLHPKQVESELPRHRPLFDQVSRSEPALELAYAADVVVGMTSMLLLESASLGRPTLSLVPRAEERAWLGEMASSIPCAWTPDGLSEILPKLFQKEASAGEPAAAGGSRSSIRDFFRENFTSSEKAHRRQDRTCSKMPSH